MTRPELTVLWQTNSKCKELLWDKAPGSTISAPLLSSLSPNKIPPPFNPNVTYFQRLLRKNWHVALSSVRWFHRKSRLCFLSLQHHQLACAGDLSKNVHLPNDHLPKIILQPYNQAHCQITHPQPLWVTRSLGFKHTLIWARNSELQNYNAQ